MALRLGHADRGTGDILLALLEAEDGTEVLAGLCADRPRDEREIAGTGAGPAAAAVRDRRPGEWHG